MRNARLKLVFVTERPYSRHNSATTQSMQVDQVLAGPVHRTCTIADVQDCHKHDAVDTQNQAESWAVESLHSHKPGQTVVLQLQEKEDETHACSVHSPCSNAEKVKTKQGRNKWTCRHCQVPTSLMRCSSRVNCGHGPKKFYADFTSISSSAPCATMIGVQHDPAQSAVRCAT